MDNFNFIKDIGEQVLSAVPKQNTVDGFIDRLNRRTVATFLFIFSFIVMTENLVGNAIKCTEFNDFLGGGGDPNVQFIEDYCWTQGLFTNRFAYHLPRESLPAPGIIPCVRTTDGYTCSEAEQKQQRVFHLWYQWIPMYFVLSAMLYIAPYFIVKITMLGSIAKLVDEVEKPEYIGKEGEEEAGAIIKRWMDVNLYSRFSHPDHNPLSPFSLVKEHLQLPVVVVMVRALYLAITVTHFYYTGKMFEIGNWYQLGIQWHVPESNNYTHIGDMLFPKMVGCIVKKWGTTGIVTETGMCSLAPNVVNQYLFLVTWFMIVVTMGLNILNILNSVVELMFHKSYYAWTRKINPGVKKEELKHVYAYYGLSGKLALYKLAQNSPISVYMAAISITSKYVRHRARYNVSLRQYFSELGYLKPVDPNDEDDAEEKHIYILN